MKQILESINEAAYRPADNTSVGQLDPISLAPQDFQAVPPAPVAPYPANVNGNIVADEGGLDEKEFINNPALPASAGNDITSVDDITARVNGVVAEDVTKIVDTVMGKLISESIYTVELKESLGQLFSAQGLNEDTQTKATDIFEAAVTAAAKSHLGNISRAANTYVAEQLELYHQAQQESINQYLNHVVTEWVDENRLAIEMGSRTRIAESFMDGLKNLLESHYVELPANRVDLYEQACVQGDRILAELEAIKEEKSALAEEVKSLKKSTILESALKGISDVKAAKVRELCENLEYVDDKSFKDRVSTIVEGYTSTAKAPTKPLTEDTTTKAPATTSAINEEVENIAKALGRMKNS